mmetsp:Transcript_24005/g.54168  ORF Transcript_24005/g.54168 Transcript_24005/m.54168 type:complete len:113 (-) Transcript_24005:617-955(-)
MAQQVVVVNHEHRIFAWPRPQQPRLDVVYPSSVGDAPTHETIKKIFKGPLEATGTDLVSQMVIKGGNDIATITHHIYILGTTSSVSRHLVPSQVSIEDAAACCARGARGTWF